MTETSSEGRAEYPVLADGHSLVLCRGVAFEVAFDREEAQTMKPNVPDHLEAFKSTANFQPGRLRLHEAAIAYQRKYPEATYPMALDAVLKGTGDPNDPIHQVTAFKGGSNSRLELHRRAIALQRERGITYVEALNALAGAGR